ncbi:MAG: bifunctional riboflavin kinase/FAD synthetase [Verrucomicrobia bacterium]|nr:bifunctional riboflavin kinase/FAD synthetase [Verrucomicrobiota bacterium]MCF7709095.1 bifunctional riboflavin kinase/FAD synthetase [Verrucomicrobiota bacterium]
MKVISNPADLKPGDKPVCLTIGVFDGVHLGHQKILSHTIKQARNNSAIALAVTFDRHPASVIAPNKSPKSIYPTEKKIQLFDERGLDAVLILKFSHEFSHKPWNAFIQQLHDELGKIVSITVGGHFHFGHHQKGNLQRLNGLGNELGFKAFGISESTLHSKQVSSTRIRHAIRNGNIELASELLGRPYSIFGKVIRGDGLGGRLGFPTANLEVTGLQLPPDGVYQAEAQRGESRHTAVVNIGQRPTLNLPNPKKSVEVHLIGFNGDLYDSEMDVVIHHKLRSEMRMPSVDALIEQIRRDIDAVRDSK